MDSRTTSLTTTIALAIAFLASAASAHNPPDPKLLAQATVTEAQARAIAQAKVPQGTIASAELEQEHGLLVWSFDMTVVGSKDITEVQVDAKTARVVSVEKETAENEAKERAAEAKEKHK